MRKGLPKGNFEILEFQELTQLVTKEQAIKLKKLGFPQYNIEFYPLEETEGEVVFRSRDLFASETVAAPTLERAANWLRKKKGLFITVEIDALDDVDVLKEIPLYTSRVYKWFNTASQMMILSESNKNESYDEVLSESLDNALNYLLFRNDKN